MSSSDSHGIRLRSVLVIGGGRKIGASACKALSEAGYVPITYDQSHLPKADREKWGPFIQGSITEKNQLSATISEYKPDSIMMCPDYVDMESAIGDPVIAYRTALDGTLNVIDLALKHAIQDFIYVSSAAIYGDAGSRPIREDQPAAPMSITGSCQMICERMISDFARTQPLRFSILRSFDIACTDEDVAENVADDGGFLSQLMAVATGRRPQLAIHGGNYETRDGTCVRDYLHGADFADALVVALRAIETGSSSRIYNIGSGIGTSALELVHIAERVSGRRIPIAYRPRFDNQPSASIADSSLARVMLGWTPKQSAADQIIRTLWSQWNKKSADHADDPRLRAAG